MPKITDNLNPVARTGKYYLGYNTRTGDLSFFQNRGTFGFVETLISNGVAGKRQPKQHWEIPLYNWVYCELTKSLVDLVGDDDTIKAGLHFETVDDNNLTPVVFLIDDVNNTYRASYCKTLELEPDQAYKLYKVKPNVITTLTGME